MSTLSYTDSAQRSDANAQMRQSTVSTVIHAVGQTDQVVLEDLANSGRNPVQVRQPYFGLNSWIRVLPDPGTQVLTQLRGDSYVRTISSYLSDENPELLEEARDGKVLYRQLRPGEIELMSSGRSYLLIGDEGDIEIRGGSNRLDLLQSELEITSIAPTHKRCTHLYVTGTIGYEERFGVVKRPDPTKPTLFQKFARLSDTAFAVEYSRWLNDKDGKLLASTQEGNVFDAQGQEKKQSSTNKPLRYERVFSHKSAGDVTFQIDDESNLFLSNSTKAKETKITLGNLNALTLTCDSTKWTVNKTGLMSFTTSLVVKSAKVRLNSVDVGFGAAPVIPAVLGTQLVAVLTTMLTGLGTFAQVYGADPALALVTPASVTSANILAGTLASSAGALSSILSTQVKLTV